MSWSELVPSPGTARLRPTPALPGPKSAVLELDASGTILRASRQAAALLGRSRKDLEGAAFGVLLHSSRRIELDVFSPHSHPRRVTARALPVDGHPGRLEVHLEAVDHVFTLAEAAHRAVASIGAAIHATGLSMTVHHVPAIPAIAEAEAIIASTLALLLEVGGSDSGAVSLESQHGPNGCSSLVLRFIPVASGLPIHHPRAGWHDDPFGLATRIGAHLEWRLAGPVPEVLLTLPRPAL